MRRHLSLASLVVLIALALSSAPGLARERNAQGRSQPQSPERAGQSGEKAQPRQRSEPQRAEPQGRAQPRPPAQAGPPPRNATPPRREIPPRYFGPSREYFFPPISTVRGWYYHPYFGFYYGPYYGPFYPYPGPFAGWSLFSASAVRTRVKPVDTLVYVNGYYAGLVDDFDGFFQRLYLPSGEHTIELRLAGYQTFRESLFLAAGDSRDVVHVMEPLRPGEAVRAPMLPRTVPDEWISTAPPANAGDRPASPFGVLTLRLDPPDAQLWVDGEAWQDVSGQAELVIHVSAGWHHVEVRKAGLRTFTTDIQLSAGATTKLNVVLTP